jgi:enoyl-CoA hydratase
MVFEFVDFHVDDGVGWFAYNRPPVNAVHWPMLRELPGALSAVLEDPAVRVLVLASSLENYFAVGADLEVFRGIDEAGMTEWVDRSLEIATLLQHSEKPVLAAINGTAVGGGFEVAFHCDLRFCADNARLGHPEIDIGFIPPIATTQSLARLLGRPAAIKYLFDGRILTAQEGLEIGLVDILCPADSLRAEVQAYAADLARKPARALAAIRKTVTLGGGMALEDGTEYARQAAIALSQTRDFQEGVAAFLEKRAPNWE